MIDLIKSGWAAAAEFFHMTPLSLVISLLAGAVCYAVGWKVYLKVKRHLSDPLTGTELAGIFGLKEPEERTKRGVVTKVFDGDTIEIGGARVVRLIGIDAPEKSRCEKLYRDAERIGVDPTEILRQGERAQQWLEEMILGQLVEVELDPRCDREDKYGRTLGHVWTTDDQGQRGFLVSAAVLMQGYAAPTWGEHSYQHHIQEVWERALSSEQRCAIGVPIPNQFLDGDIGGRGREPRKLPGQRKKELGPAHSTPSQSLSIYEEIVQGDEEDQTWSESEKESRPENDSGDGEPPIVNKGYR